MQLNYIIGLFAYYSKWINGCSNYTTHLVKNRDTINQNGFSPDAKKAFEYLKSELVASSLAAPIADSPFKIETDASDIALGGILSQKSRPVAFFS